MNSRSTSHLRRLGAVVIGAAAVLALAAQPAMAKWTASAQGSGRGTAGSVGTVTGGSQTSSTTTSVTIGWTRTTPDTAGFPVTYTVTRTGTASVICNATTATTCTESGFTASSTPSTFTYTITPKIGGWTGTVATVANAGPAAAATLAISSVVRDAGNKKVHFTGTGAAASTTITVTICLVNSFPCSSPVTTSVATTPSAGNWTSSQSGANLNDSTNYFAQAKQGSTTSATFPFTVTAL